MTFSQGRALVVGVGSHAHIKGIDVPVTVRDATQFAAVLTDARYCGYPAERVSVLHDAAATRQGLIDALKALAQAVAEGDTVTIFFAGHGDYDTAGKYCLITHDAKADDAAQRIVPGTGLSEDELLLLLREIKAKRVLMIFNACHSGEVSPQTLSATPATAPATLVTAAPPKALRDGLLGTGSGRIIITACGDKDERSWVGSGELTLFTQALVDALQGDGVMSRNGFISVYDLYQHVYETVHDEVAERFKAAQNPEITVIKGVGPFAVSLCRGASTLGAFDESAALPGIGKVRQVTPEKAQSIVNNVIANNKGIAIQNSTIHGDVIQGDKVMGNKIGRQINTSGGPYIAGDVKADGDFVGRDKVVHVHQPELPEDAEAKLSDAGLKLYACLNDYFDANELSDLAFRLSIDWDNLQGTVKKAKARAFVAYCEKRGTLTTLRALVLAERPNLVGKI